MKEKLRFLGLDVHADAWLPYAIRPPDGNLFLMLSQPKDYFSVWCIK
jgi:hypothetical protein